MLGYSKKGTTQKMVAIEKQAMRHEAQMIDSQRRIISGINGAIRAIESQKKDRLEDELNNLSIQVTVASGVFHDKRFRGQHSELLKNLKMQFGKLVTKLPDRLRKELGEILTAYDSVFDGPLKKDIELKGCKGKVMSPEDQKAALSAINYASIMNDKQMAALDTAQSAEELTMFKEKEIQPMDEENYLPEYKLVKEHRRVFKGYFDSITTQKGMESHPKIFLNIETNGNLLKTIVIAFTNDSIPEVINAFVSLCTGKINLVVKESQ